MLGLLMLLGGGVTTPPPAPAMPTTKSMDWLWCISSLLTTSRIPGLLSASIFPLLAWLRSNSAAAPWDGVKRTPWSQESLLREDSDEFLWFFGPAGDNNYGVAGVRLLHSGKRELVD